MASVQELNQERERKALEVQQEKAMLSYEKLAELTSFRKELIGIIHKTVAKDTTPSELAYFLTFSKSVGLNPLNKEIWCYKNTKGDVIIFTGRDGFLKKNKENPTYRGMKSSEVCEFDEFEIDMIEGTVTHKITTNRGKKILGAYAIVYHEGMQPTIVWLDFDEFDLGQAKWKSSPKMMIKKCAQSHALKEAAGITGLQAEEAFVVNNGIASTKTEDVEHTEDTREADRLMLLIANAKNLQALDRIKKDCVTPDEIAAWDSKKKELENG